MTDSVIQEHLTKWYSIVIGALLVYSLVTFARKSLFNRRHGCKEPPKMEGGIGSIPLLLSLLKNKSEGLMMDMNHKMLNSAGNVRNFYMRVVGVRVILTKEPENIKAVLATQFTDFALGTRHAHFKPLLGDGIFTLDGEGWKHSRAMLRPQFAREQVAHVKALEPHLQILAKHIRNGRGKTIELQELFFKLTVDTASEFLFGQSVGSLHDSSVSDQAALDFGTSSSFAESFNVAQTYLASRSYSQMFYWMVNNKEFKDSCNNVHAFAKYYVNRALNFTPQELEEKSKEGYVFLYELVKQTRDATVLQDQLLNILVAGRDTTAGLLSFIFYELARNPEIFEKLKKEVYSAFGSGENSDIESITFESLKKCEYLKFVINEALRLYPSVPVNFRVATKDTTLPTGGGPDGKSPIYVGKGQTVAYQVYSTHRLEEYYGKDSEEFRPERWADLKKLGWAYVPFNGGPRICLGQQFALTEASYITVRLLQMFPNLVSKDTGSYPPRKSDKLQRKLVLR
ncbi:cytochrome P450 [Suhomyces tanzawaensis NRRL Y-17324]|uniref:Cytochrome P450 n=1 Tax=Suhomyces tanzawaensis NRRL Y-17324 TaxID=984487 RepID=A0A1E4SLN6_9ASCO|nr:cytochrome P450 [Suhomyces tanzawaensis NRRL Y-17324]ODV80420.1 cytochrome P450 [Suhomyces tanzawaensis NRRL Y-17324]